MKLSFPRSCLVIFWVMCQVNGQPSRHRQNSKRMLIHKAPSADQYIRTDVERSRSGRQIQPLACISKSGNEKGVCMFAWNCVESGGKHLGTCIDRFYFGSCCLLPSGEKLPEVTQTNPDDDENNADKISDNEISDETLAPSKQTSPRPSSTSSTVTTETTSTTTTETATTSTTTSTTTTVSTTTTTSTTPVSTTVTTVSTITTTTTTTITTTTATTTTTTLATSKTTTSSTSTTRPTSPNTPDVTTTIQTSSATPGVAIETSSVDQTTSTDIPFDSSDPSTTLTDSSQTTTDENQSETNSSQTTSDENQSETNYSQTTTDEKLIETNYSETTTDENLSEINYSQTTTDISLTTTDEYLTPTDNSSSTISDLQTTDTSTLQDISTDNDEESDTTTFDTTVIDSSAITEDLSSQETTTLVSNTNKGNSSLENLEATTNSIETTTLLELEGEQETSTVSEDSSTLTTSEEELTTENLITGANNSTELDVTSVLLEEDNNVNNTTEQVALEEDIDPVVIESDGTNFTESESVDGSDVPNTQTWIPIKVENGQMKPAEGLGGGMMKPGQFYNCSEISSDLFNCSIVTMPTSSQGGSVVTNDLSDIKNAIAAATGGSGTAGKPIIIDVEEVTGPESVAGTVVTPNPSGDTDTATTKPHENDFEKNSVNKSTEKPLHDMTYREACGRRPWLNATYRSKHASPRSGRMISTDVRTELQSIVDLPGLFQESGHRTGKIVNGEKAEYGEWPWQVSLRQWRTATFLHKCGAALLSENWAITAAHCVESVNPDELLLRMGEYDLNNEASEPYTFQDRKVQIVASHPKFDPKTFEYDLALLRFYEPVTFQPNIIPVCVPDVDEDLVGETAWVTGWGRLYEDGPLPSVLQEVDLPIINNTQCEAMYEKAGFREHIPHIFICAGYREGGKDSCEGDSGGPMAVLMEDGRYDLAGIISWGIGCAKRNQPGVMTRIAYFRDWINTIIKF